MALYGQHEFPYVKRNGRQPPVVLVGVFVGGGKELYDGAHRAARVEDRAAQRPLVVGGIRVAVPVAVIFVYDFGYQFNVALEVGYHGRAVDYGVGNVLRYFALAASGNGGGLVAVNALLGGADQPPPAAFVRALHFNLVARGRNVGRVGDKPY